MARKCPECGECGRAHLVGCSYGPSALDREAFIRANAVQLVRELEARVRRQALELSKLNHALAYKRKKG